MGWRANKGEEGAGAPSGYQMRPPKLQPKLHSGYKHVKLAARHQRSHKQRGQFSVVITPRFQSHGDMISMGCPALNTDSLVFRWCKVSQESGIHTEQRKKSPHSHTEMGLGCVWVVFGQIPFEHLPSVGAWLAPLDAVAWKAQHPRP